MTISFITVNYRNHASLARSLASLPHVDEVVVVDHSEDPEEFNFLKTLPIHTLVRQKNSGYGAGLNRGAREAGGDILIFSNPDVEYLPNSIESMITVLEKNNVGAVGPQLLWNRNPDWYIPSVTTPTWWKELHDHLRPRRATKTYIRKQLNLWGSLTPVSVPVLSGTVLITSREVFTDSGGFDERFFLFFEENDWCVRLRRKGLKLFVVPSSQVIHDIGVSKDMDRVADHFTPSYRLFRRLHFPPWYVSLRPAPPTPPSLRRERERAESVPAQRGDWILISPYPDFIPSAGYRCAGGETDPKLFFPAGAGSNAYHTGLHHSSRVPCIDRFHYLGTVQVK